MFFGSAFARGISIAFAIGLASAAQASFVSSSPNPFAVGNLLVGTDSCVASGPLAGVCTTNNSTVFTASSFTFPGDDNQHIEVTAVLSGDLSSGLGPYALTGTYRFTLLGRTSASQFGTFSLVEDFVDLQGTVLGMPVSLVHNPDVPSVGFASISSNLCNGCEDKFLIDIGLTVNALFVIGGGEPVPVSSDLTGSAGAVPEASTWAMMLFGFGVAGLALRRRQALRGPDAVSAAS